MNPENCTIMWSRLVRAMPVFQSTIDSRIGSPIIIVVGMICSTIIAGMLTSRSIAGSPSRSVRSTFEPSGTASSSVGQFTFVCSARRLCSQFSFSGQSVKSGFGSPLTSRRFVPPLFISHS